LIACTLGTLAAIAIDRYDFPGRRLFHVITMMPLVLPELVMGLMCLLWFATLRITLGTWSIVCAHVTFSVSYVLLTVRARLVEFDHRLELAAQDLGARPGQVLWHITIPLVMPAALAGGMMAFTLSFDDFLISFFTAGTNADTLPIKLYGLIKFGLNREIYAVSTSLLAVTLSVVLIRGVVSKGKNYF
jgi:spermidine/putrescine transport system permease protein